jgi:hypothetical protein
VGLNLTAADYVVHLDPWWNPAVEGQASYRADRIGQARLLDGLGRPKGLVGALEDETLPDALIDAKSGAPKRRSARSMLR